jgi:hypothetical protein
MEMFASGDFARLREHLRIGQFALDEELIRHPGILMECLERHIDAVQRRDAAEHRHKMEITIEMARLRDEVKPGEKKPAETAIKEEALFGEEVLIARAALEEAQASVSYWQALCASMTSKGSSLKRLSELTVAGYLAPTSAGNREGMQEARRKAAERAQDRAVL